VEWKEPLYHHVQEIWEAEYLSQSNSDKAMPDAIITTELDPFEAYLVATNAPTNDDDIFISFISSAATVIDRDSILTWWNDPTNPW
jgi:hypothetical protein